MTSKDPQKEGILRDLNRDYNGGVARALFSLAAKFTSLDRGDFLEDSFDRFVLGAGHRGTSMTIGQVWVPESSHLPALMPAWAANSVVFQNGAIFPMTPDVLKEYGVYSYVHARRKSFISGDTLEDFGRMPLAVAMKASASFPSLLPATTLVTARRDHQNPFLHLQDGGLADNLGILSAYSLVAQLDTQPGTTALILIDAFNGETEPYSRRLGSPRFYQAFGRATSISLDSWHGRFRRIFQALLPNRHPICLGFKEVQDTKLRDQIRAIGTRIKINGDQQAALLKAAKEVVQFKEKELCQALLPEPTLPASSLGQP